MAAQMIHGKMERPHGGQMRVDRRAV